MSANKAPADSKNLTYGTMIFQPAYRPAIYACDCRYVCARTAKCCLKYEHERYVQKRAVLLDDAKFAPARIQMDFSVITASAPAKRSLSLLRRPPFDTRVSSPCKPRACFLFHQCAHFQRQSEQRNKSFCVLVVVKFAGRKTCNAFVVKTKV